MGRLLSAYAAVTVVALTVVPGAARAASDCSPPGAHALKRSRLVTVYQQGERVFACLRSNRTARWLGGQQADPLLPSKPARRFHIAGRRVGYLRGGDCEDCWRLVVINVATGHLRMSYPVRLFPGDPFEAVAIDAQGRAAWVAQYGQMLELHAMDGRGEETVDSGTGLAGVRPVIRGSGVTWSRNGRTREYRFRRRRCGLENSTTLERNRLARLYWASNAVWGCMLGDGQRRRLGARPIDNTDGYHGGAFAKLSGRFASIDEGSGGGRYDSGVSKADLSVTDIASGKVVHRWAADNSRVLSVVLATTGAIAWVDEASGFEPFEVRKSDTEGEGTLLDTSRLDEIDPASLRLDANETTVSWMHGGEMRTTGLH
jgi:hypothetical protein